MQLAMVGVLEIDLYFSRYFSRYRYQCKYRY